MSVFVYWYADLRAQGDKGLPSQREPDTGTFGDSALYTVNSVDQSFLQ